MKKILLAALWFLLCWGIGVASAAARYQVIDLGTLGVWSSAKIINNQGQVLGAWGPTTGSNRVFLYDHGVLTDLNLGGYPNGLNNLGQIVVKKYSPVNGKDHAFLLEQGNFTDLGFLEGMDSSDGLAINDAGQVIGDSYSTSTWKYRAFIWQNGVLTKLQTFAPDDKNSFANGINQSGQVAGNIGSQAVLWQGGVPQVIDGLPGWEYHGANDINDSGQVVGESHSTTAGRGFLWHNGSIQDLGNLPGQSFTSPSAINNKGQVVGYCGTGPAFIWENGVITDLNYLIPPDSGWVLEYALDINDAGQIVGQGAYNAQTRQAFLLTPVPLAGPGLPAVESLLLLH